MKITIAHLYPDMLNLYGDNGNIAALTYRLRQRGVEADVCEYAIDDKIDFENTDILFIGGGSDSELLTVGKRMLDFKDELRLYAENGGCVLAVCGGFQILADSYVIGGKRYDGTGVLNIKFDQHSERLIGNIVTECSLISDTVVGFENHSGILETGEYTPLGKVVTGYGNTASGVSEGLVYKNVIATFMHGPILPKNPKLTDYILKVALKNRYNIAELTELDDTLENLAHDYAVGRFSK